MRQTPAPRRSCRCAALRSWRGMHRLVCAPPPYITPPFVVRACACGCGVVVQEEMEGMTDNSSLVSFFKPSSAAAGGAGAASSASSASASSSAGPFGGSLVKRLIVMDEVDGMSSGDRG